MATLFDVPDTTVSFPIVKMEETPDGDLIVYGKATDGSVDSDDQIVDSDWSGKALESWLKTGGNVRVQHSPQLYPAGKGIEVEVGKDGAHWVRSLIVEDTAKNLVRKGVLTAYSVGIAKPQIVRDAGARGGRIVGGQIAELSLVDRPANKNCGITLVKSDGGGAPHVINKMWGTTNGGSVPVIEKDDETVTATVTFTPKDLAAILGKGKKPPAMEDTDADPTNEGGGPDGDDDMDEKDDFGGGDEEASSPEAKGKDFPARDKGRIGKAKKGKGKGKGKVPPEFASHQFDNDADNDGDTDEAEDDAAKKTNAGPFVEKREFSQDQRDSLASSGKAMPDGSFPIANTSDLHNAVQAFGRAKNKAGVKQHIKRRAAALGATDALPDSWKAEDATVKKAAKVPCPNCGKKVKPTAKFCPGCGKEMKADVTKGMATPASAGKPKAKDMTPVPGHREPDGPQMEEFERDAGIEDSGGGDESPSTNVPGSDWDSTVSRPGSSAGTSLKGSLEDVPMAVKRLHDLTCAAYSIKSINQTYPALSGIAEAIDVEDWRQKALQAAGGADYATAEKAFNAAQAADFLVTVDANTLADARSSLHKAFSDMYPNVSVIPTEIDPGRYRRPYLSAGHARDAISGQGSQPPQPRANQITAQDFQRGSLTDGHERPSPGNKGGNAGVPGGSSTALFMGSAARNQAEASLKNLHDHICDTYPQVCPMSATATPSSAVGKAEEPKVKKGKGKGKGKLKNAPDTLNKAAVATSGGVVTALSPDLIKSAMSEVLAERDQQIAGLQKRIAELEQLPNPYETAYRGPAMLTKSQSPSGVPEEAQSVIQKAAAQRNEALFGYLQNRSVYAPSPAEREQARAALNEMMNER